MAIKLFTDVNYGGTRRTFRWNHNAHYDVNLFIPRSAKVDPNETWKIRIITGGKVEERILIPGLYPDLQNEHVVTRVSSSDEFSLNTDPDRTLILEAVLEPEPEPEPEPEHEHEQKHT